MIELKEAVTIALQHTREVFGAVEQPVDLRLEELELADDQTTWQVTVSFLRPIPWRSTDIQSIVHPWSDRQSRMFWVGGKPYTRDYKQLIVDAATGAVRSLRVRELV
jgi:hypothetical protein